MIRTGLVFAAGALAGAAAVFVVLHRAPSPEPLSGGSRAALDAAETARSATAAASLDVDARLDVYRLAAEADLTTLERRIAAAASEPDSARRRFTLEVLLLRLAELDTARALRAARDLRLAPDVRAALHARVAEADFELALDGLVTITDIEAAHAAGLAVLAARDYDPSALEAVVAALPGADAREFRIEALAALARLDPGAALEQARTMADTALRGRALNEVARVWAHSAPETALARAAELGGNGAERFRAAVYGAWAAADPVAALRHAARNDARPMSIASLFGPASSGFGDADPHTLLAVADEFEGQYARLVKQAAVRRLTAEDPAAALAYLESLDNAAERESLVRLAAHAYGRHAPEAALAWARGMQPPQPQLVTSVLGGIADNDVSHALRLALALPDSAAERADAVARVVMYAHGASDAELGRLADTVLEQAPGAARQRALQSLAQQWRMSDPEGALEWFAANAEALSPPVFSSIAFSIAQQNSELAARYVERVPRAARTDWIQAVATGFARSDPRRAVDWIAQYRGDPAYPAAAAAAAQGFANLDPPAAARLLEGAQIEGIEARGPAMAVARAWTERDPYTAAQWAAGLEDAELRGVAVASVAQLWTARDAPSAQSWIMSLPRGEARDRGLGVLVRASAQSRTPEASLIEAFSSDRARERYLTGAAAAIAQRDEAAARRFVDTYFETQAGRERALRMLEGSFRPRVGTFGGFQVGSGISMGPGPFVGPNGEIIRAAPVR